MEKFKVYIMERVNEIYERRGEESLLFNRNVASSLANINKFLSKDACTYHRTSYLSELQNFKEAASMLDTKLVFTSPFEGQVSRK